MSQPARGLLLRPQNPRSKRPVPEISIGTNRLSNVAIWGLESTLESAVERTRIVARKAEA